MTSVAFSDLPNKALNTIFSYLSQSERQKLRVVCHFWKNLMDDGFPIELTINQGNYEHLFQCPNASTVEIQNLTTEYTGNVAFGPRLRSVQFSGKVLSSNILSILRHCPDLEKLTFSSLKQVLGIEGVESVKLPKATLVEIKVRPDQETFSSDDIIIISTLRQIIFGSLETIVISTGSPYEIWEEDSDEVDYNPSEVSEDGETQSFTMSAVSPMSSTSARVEEVEDDDALQLPLDVEEEQSIAVIGESLDLQQPSTSGMPGESGAQTTGTQTANTNLHVIINRAANFPNVTGSEDATSMSRASSRSSSRRVRYNMSEFEARLFHANLELLLMDSTGSNELSVFNDSLSRTRMDSTTYFETPGTTAPAIKHTVFFEFVRNNHSSLKNLYVRTRSDFMCFGNLNGFIRDVPRVQFEEIDYSFGRMQMCYEYVLLRAQCKLRKLKMQVLDDMWRHLMLAVETSQETLTDLDIKVMSASEDRVDIIPITHCSILKSLKLLHFFEKESLCRLPKTLNKLVLNGPVSYEDMTSWTNELLELVDLTLLLNIRGDKIDLPLYKRFLKMPNLNKLTLIQCPTDLDAIKRYIEHTLSAKAGLKFWINGPQEMKDMPAIQYVYTAINPDQFNREQIQLE